MEHKIGDMFIIVREDQQDFVGNLLKLDSFDDDGLLLFRMIGEKPLYGSHDPNTLKWVNNNNEYYSDVAPLSLAMKIMYGVE